MGVGSWVSFLIACVNPAHTRPVLVSRLPDPMLPWRVNKRRFLPAACVTPGSFMSNPDRTFQSRWIQHTIVLLQLNWAGSRTSSTRTGSSCNSWWRKWGDLVTSASLPPAWKPPVSVPALPIDSPESHFSAPIGVAGGSEMVTEEPRRMLGECDPFWKRDRAHWCSSCEYQFPGCFSPCARRPFHWSHAGWICQQSCTSWLFLYSCIGWPPPCGCTPAGSTLLPALLVSVRGPAPAGSGADFALGFLGIAGERVGPLTLVWKEKLPLWKPQHLPDNWLIQVRQRHFRVHGQSQPSVAKADKLNPPWMIDVDLSRKTRWLQREKQSLSQEGWGPCCWNVRQFLFVCICLTKHTPNCVLLWNHVSVCFPLNAWFGEYFFELCCGCLCLCFR